jgi:hypothetical protein
VSPGCTMIRQMDLIGGSSDYRWFIGGPIGSAFIGPLKYVQRRHESVPKRLIRAELCASLARVGFDAGC